MAWNDTFTQTYDWSKTSNFEMFWKALNERRASLGQSALYVPAVGADVQSATTSNPASTTGSFSLYVIQNWIETYYGSFVQSHETDGTIRATDYYSGKSSIDMWTLDNLRRSAGLVDVDDYTHGFTRKWPREVANTSSTTDLNGTACTSGMKAWVQSVHAMREFNGTNWNTSATEVDVKSGYGKVQAGDYFGDWLWTEIRNCLNRLIWTKTSQLYEKAGETVDEKVSSVGPYSSWAAAWSAALTAYHAASWVTKSAAGDFFYHSPWGYGAGCLNIDGIGTKLYYANARRVRRYLEARNTHASSSMKCDVDFYIKTEAPPNDWPYTGGLDSLVYDQAGLSWPVQNAFSLCYTKTGNTNSTVDSDMVGDSSVDPPQPGEPTNTYRHTALGFRSTQSPTYDGRAVLRWNIDGGFAYKP